MADKVSDDVARTRWLIINAARLSGAAMVLVGLLITAGRLPVPAWTGYVILGAGLFDVFWLPQILSRRWRSPPE